MATGEIIGINISERRGTQKKEIPEVDLVKGFGLADDAHGGNWHRQVSLLSFEKITEFNERGARVGNGAFGENIIVSGIDLRRLPVGTKIQIGDASLVVTQIGKECHKHCQIYARVGDCIMPREGIFAVVVDEGHIKKGDTLEVV
ncbi:MOSC domain-containing protein [Enterococcus sp. DIV0242_7C1]|uniref:MOSC domain-containing protein n=2 Tax=Enterococcus TaxID=1350 RepID=A0A200JEI2_9ENTE|nr:MULTISPECIES: MOSC domain-containing protein [Enterococcus]MBO0469734.1 MOSC domain-containing protein [Enterococcus sp. DIV0242_7C1]MCA5011739.1 MOSC domain-containing protein [Enterococcus sp. S23]MCA5014819.1 MOSC domain-containing protein [Enterococcus sp. S22(2020)]OUZ34977.1 MOSC domain-containing protein [Enterococcus sp. 9D6_DIV0238]GGC77599.1 molybdenum cofactor biosynthesis protein MoaC [Enterococcus wangshanyuanii]